jgi:hypothetical protein
MRLSEVTAHIVGTLGQNAFLSGIEILSTIEEAFNQKLETALRETGIALVVTQASGASAGGKGPQLYLENTVMVSVLENPATNTTGRSCLQCVEEVLQWLHQHGWPSQRGLQNVLTVDNPAYEAGPLDGGLVVYFCNFKVLTIQPIHE